MNLDWIDSFLKNIPECIIHKILNLRPIHPVAELLKPEFDSEFAIFSGGGKLFILDQYYLGRHQNGREEWKEMKKDEELLMNGVERRTYFY